MNKRLYYILITIAFGIISIPTVLSIIFREPILLKYIDRALIKTILIFLISVLEANYITHKISKALGWVFAFVLFIGLQFHIMHWTGGNKILIAAGLAILINLTTMAIIERNKGLLHYLLFLFVLQRLIIILTPPNEILWWIDVIVCFVITVIGMIYILNVKTQEASKNYL